MAKRALVLTLLCMGACMGRDIDPNRPILDHPPQLQEATDTMLFLTTDIESLLDDQFYLWWEFKEEEQDGWKLLKIDVANKNFSEAQIANLSSNTSYQVRTLLQSGEKLSPFDSPDVPVAKARTCSGPPGHVTELLLKGMSESKFEVSWVPPEKTCDKAIFFFYGRLNEGNKVAEWTPWGSSPGTEDNDLVQFCENENWRHCVILDNLDTTKDYTVEVRVQRRTGAFGKEVRAYAALGGPGGGGWALLALFGILAIALIIYVICQIKRRRKQRASQNLNSENTNTEDSRLSASISKSQQ